MEKAELLPKELKWHFIGGLQSSMCHISSHFFPAIHVGSSNRRFCGYHVHAYLSLSSPEVVREVSLHICTTGYHIWLFLCSGYRFYPSTASSPAYLQKSERSGGIPITPDCHFGTVKSPSSSTTVSYIYPILEAITPSLQRWCNMGLHFLNDRD